MVKLNRRLLLDAADAYPRASAPENRLTEILAEVLRTSPQLLTFLASRAFPADEAEIKNQCVGGRYEVETQFSLGAGRERPDLRVRFLSTHGGHDHRFYIENKLGAAPTPAQLDGYRTAGSSPVILVHLGSPPEWSKVARFIPTSWTDVAREAFRLGVSWAHQHGSAWPDYALTSNAPSEYRMLAELCRYLEREVQVTIPRPLTTSDLEILPSVLDTRARWDQLKKLIDAELSENPGIAKRFDPWEGRPLDWSFSLLPQDGWPALQRYWETVGEDAAPPEAERWMRPGIIMSLSIPWAPSEVQTPSVGVGIGVHLGAEWLPGLREHESFYRAARDAGFEFGATWRGTVGRVIKTLNLKELDLPGKTLDEQAAEIVQWTRDTLQILSTLQPAQDVDPRPADLDTSAESG